MSQTPPWLYGWEDLSCELNTHHLQQEKEKEFEEEEEEEYLSILREAQRESCEPESRLISPLPLSADTEELTSVCQRKVSLEDFLWDWSSRINVSPPPEWRLQAKYSSSSCSLRDSRKSSKDNPGKERGASGDSGDSGDQGYFSLLLSNIISLIIGTGLGVLLYKRNVFKQSSIFL